MRFKKQFNMNKITSTEDLKLLINSKSINNVDLSEICLDGLNFADCTLQNVIISREDQDDRCIRHVNFQTTKFENVFFDHSVLEDCNFDGKETKVHRVSFKKCRFEKCRFRRTQFSWSDFRYAEINFGTFEEAHFLFCDFYRCFFIGIIIFRKATFDRCSLYYSYFDEGAAIRKDNLANNKILQQSKNDYYKFLVDWPIHGPGLRKNDQGNQSDWDPSVSLSARYADAEDIYKTLNGLWMSKGFLGDANWAYVKGKRMERFRMQVDIFQVKRIGLRLNLLLKICWNYVTDILFGYGESMFRMVATYFITVFIFAFIYHSSSHTNLGGYLIALIVSLKNMVAMTPDDLQGVSPFLDFLNMVQTTIGILITGIFGFILGNKIRNQ